MTNTETAMRIFETLINALIWMHVVDSDNRSVFIPSVRLATTKQELLDPTGKGNVK